MPIRSVPPRKAQKTSKSKKGSKKTRPPSDRRVGRCPSGSVRSLSRARLARDRARPRALGRRVPGVRERHKGKLAAIAGGRCGKALAAIVRELEAIDDLIGRIASFPSSSTPATPRSGPRQVFRDVQERITRRPRTCCSFRSSSTRSTTRSEPRMAERRSAIPAVDRGRPQGKALSARGSHRAALP